ncbi:MAG: tol-pal system protein YbgF [Pseudorhodoplanes sp.]
MRPAFPAFVLTLALAAGANPAFAQMSNSDLVVRVEQLENQIRQMTGTIEQLQYRNQQLEQQLRRAQGDAGGNPAGAPGAGVAAVAPPPGQRPMVQGRPTALPPLESQPSQIQQPPAVMPPQQGPAPVASNRRSDVFDPSQNPNAPGAPRVLGNMGVVAQPDTTIMSDETAPVGAPGGRAPGTPLDLSTASGESGGGIVQDGLPPARNPNAAVASVAPPSQTPRDLFDLGVGSIQRKDYALAEEAFRDFLKRYPSDRMVPDAQYWLGESLFQRQRYRDAAEIFLGISTKYETAGKAPDAMLRLGQSLAALREKEAACATFAQVGVKYPRASVSVKQGAEREQKRVRC